MSPTQDITNQTEVNETIVKLTEGPRHLGIIPDGNRRWGKINKVPENSCHHFGVESCLPVLEELFKKTTTQVYTLWGMSTENFNRPHCEVKALFRVIKSFMEKGLVLAHKYECSVHAFGQIQTKLPQDILEIIRNAEKETKHYTKIQLNVGINYGGRTDITEAVNRFIENNPGKLITQNDITKYISLANCSIPEPDLIVRTGATDECKRTSGFLTWQSIYTEFYFIDKLFPDITFDDVLKGYEAYTKGTRKYGV